MIRMMTEENARALDAQIARSYRRRMTRKRWRAQVKALPALCDRQSRGLRVSDPTDVGPRWLARLAGDLAALGRTA